MEIRTRIKGKKVYIDTNIIIYILEGFPLFESFLKDIIESVEDSSITLFTGEITVAEAMVMPFRNEDTELIKIYLDTLNDEDFITLIPTTKKIYLKSAFLRAEYPSMKTPDAIQVASAVVAQADVFITNDSGIKTPSSIEKIVLNECLKEQA